MGNAEVAPLLNSLTFRWLGVAGIELISNEHTLLVDPFFTRPPFRKVLLGRVNPDEELVSRHIQTGDLILITHSHYDHLMDVPVVARKTGATVMGSGNTCRLLEICGVPVEQLRQIQSGDQFSLNGFNVKVFPSQHIRLPIYRPGQLKPKLRPPLRLVDYRMDESFSYLIHIDGLRVLLWSGNSANGAEKADILFTYFMGKPPFYRALLNKVQPSLVIPIHWDNLFRPLTRPLKPSWRPPRLGFPAWFRARPEAFTRTLAHLSPSARVLVPEIFKTYDFSRLDPLPGQPPDPAPASPEDNLQV